MNSNVFGYVPREEAHIVWTIDDGGTINWLAVYRFGLVPEDVWYDCDAGASFTDWCCGDPCLTPEGVYFILQRTGFSTPAVHQAALRELSQIQGCEWARLGADALESDADTLESDSD